MELPRPTLKSHGWVLGVFLFVMSTGAWALWVVLQGPLLLEYPSKLLNTALQCLFSSIQSFFLALIIERDFSRWKIGLDGVIVSGISYYLRSRTIEKKGPVFLAMSVPLTLVLTIILSTVLLGEAIRLGSVLGGIFLIGGLYNVLWGKRMEALHSKIEASNEAEAFAEEDENTKSVETTRV